MYHQGRGPFFYCMVSVVQNTCIYIRTLAAVLTINQSQSQNSVGAQISTDNFWCTLLYIHMWYVHRYNLQHLLVRASVYRAEICELHLPFLTPTASVRKNEHHCKGEKQR